MHLLHSKGQSLGYSPGRGNPGHSVVALYVGEGSEREQCCLFSSLPAFSHFPCYPQANWALLVLIPKWVGLCMFQDPVGLSNELSCETGSFSCHRLVFQSEFSGLSSPSLEPWVVRSVSLPSYSSQFICLQMWDHLVRQPLPHLVHHLLPCCESPLPQLPISTPPTGLDECFFFNSLVVGLPYHLIFWWFWLFFVFKFVVVLLVV